MKKNVKTTERRGSVVKCEKMPAVLRRAREDPVGAFMCYV